MHLYNFGRHARHLERALAVASTSTQRQRHGAIVARNGRVLSVGINAQRNPPLNCTDPETQAGLHAEMAAIRALPPGTDCSRLTIYSVRIMRSDQPGLAKPCKHCAAEIARLGFKEVIYT